MAERSLIFPAGEYRARVARLQRRMAEDGLDALLLTMPADIFYVTGFLTRFWESPARPWYVVLPATGAPVAVIPAIGAGLMGRTWITDIRSWNAPDPADDGIGLLVEAIREVTPRAGRIGLPMGAETHARMPLADLRHLERRLAPRALADATATVQRVREIKSEAEIAKLRAACAVADRAFARVPEMARPGRPLDVVFRDFQIALLQEGADWVSYVAGGAGRNGYSDVISPASAAPLARGDVLMLDTGAVRDGYFCDFDRNFAIGEACDAARRTHAALWQATDATLGAAKPGMTAGELHGHLARAIRRAGAEPLDGRLGHGLGLSLTEWPSLTPGDRTELRAGMVLALEPGATMGDGRIMVHEENVVLRAEGCALLSRRAPAELPVIGA